MDEKSVLKLQKNVMYLEEFYKSAFNLFVDEIQADNEMVPFKKFEDILDHFSTELGMCIKGKVKKYLLYKFECDLRSDLKYE